MRSARKYTPQGGKLKAASACREKGWTIHTWLNSESWNGPRQILAFDGGTSEFVKLNEPCSGSRRTMVLPADIHAVPAPVPIPRCQHSRKLSDPCKYCGRPERQRCVHGTTPPEACKHCPRHLKPANDL